MPYRNQLRRNSNLPGLIRGVFTALFITSAAVSVLFARDLYEPTAILLTWQNDPATTMTID